jgi:hypothetical protein
MHRWSTRLSLCASAFDIDALEQVVELSLRDHHRAATVAGFRDFELSAVQSLVEDAESRSIEEQDL